MGEASAAAAVSHDGPSSRPAKRRSSADASDHSSADPALATRTAVARSTSIKFSAADDDAYSSGEDDGRGVPPPSPFGLLNRQPERRLSNPSEGGSGLVPDTNRSEVPQAASNLSLCSLDSAEGNKARAAGVGGRLRNSRTDRSVCTVVSFNDLDKLDVDEEEESTVEGGESTAADFEAVVGSAERGAASSMTIETSNAYREMLDMVNSSEHGESSLASGSEQLTQPSQTAASSSSQWNSNRRRSNANVFTRRWTSSDILPMTSSFEDLARADKEVSGSEPSLVSAGEMRKRRRRGVARRVARAALGVLAVAALSVSAVLLLTGEGSGIRRTTKGILDSVLGTSYEAGDDGGNAAAAAAAAGMYEEEDDGARRAVETSGLRGFHADPSDYRDFDDGRLARLPDDRRMSLGTGGDGVLVPAGRGDGREARAVSMLGAKLRRAEEEAAAMANMADGSGRSMMMTNDPLAMAREEERQEDKVVTLNGVRVSLHDLVRYQEGQREEGTAGLL